MRHSLTILTPCSSAKSWQLGWYADKALTVTPLADRQHEFFLTLASVVDYQRTNSNVLIKVNQIRSPWAFFLNYNAAKGMNRMTQEGSNQVLVTTKNTANEENLSMLTKMMDPGDTLTIKNFNRRDGETLNVRFVSVSNGEANIAISLSGPSVPSPTLSPTEFPSPAPTKGPTNAPTKTVTIPPKTPPPSIGTLSRGAFVTYKAHAIFQLTSTHFRILFFSIRDALDLSNRYVLGDSMAALQETLDLTTD